MDLRRSKQSVGNNKFVIAAIIVAVLIAVAAFVVWKSNMGSGVNRDGYQLVSLTTGERYIGKLSNLEADYVTLDNVYYQQNAAPEGEGEQQAQDITVAKLSSSVAKPEDTMKIASDKIVHWENLQDDSKIVEAIRQDGSEE